MLSVRLLILGCLCLCLFLSSCGGGGGTTPAPVIDPPIVQSVILPTLVLLDSTVAINAEVEGEVTAWHWTFGTGTFPAASTQTNPSVRFDARGIFTGMLIAENSGGQSAPFTFNYTVVRVGETPDPTSVMSVAPLGTIGHAGHPIEFQATAADANETFEWDFKFLASPTSVIDPSPEIVYRDAGTFDARVRAKNPYGFGPWFDFQVNVLPFDGGNEEPLIIDLIGEGEMGPSGGQATFAVATTAFPTEWEWHFGGGAIPEVSVERSGVVTLGAPGLYHGTVRVSTPNRDSQTYAFTYSVGGFEATRMRSQWAGNWTAYRGLVPLANGRLASLVDLDSERANGTDLDPTCMTELGLPLGRSADDPLELATAALYFTGPAGEIEQVLTWETDFWIDFGGFLPGPNDSMLLALTISDIVGTDTEFDLQPGPGERIIPLVGYRDTLIMALDNAGQILWTRSFGEGSYATSADNLTVWLDGSVFLANQEQIGSDYPHLLHKLAPDGTPLWQTEIMQAPLATAATPDGGCLLLGIFNTRSDFNPVAPGTDVRDPLGESDAYLTKYDSQGTYQWTRRWGGAPTFIGSKGADLNASSLMVKPNGNIYAAGAWRVDGVDFQPGAGEVMQFPVPGCNPYLNYSGSAYVLQLSPTGGFRAVQTWGAEARRLNRAGARLADRPGDNYAVSFYSHPCLDLDAQRDLDPGPASTLCVLDTTQVVLLIDGAGNLAGKAEWAADTTEYYYIAQAPALFPAPDGGLYAQWQGATPDLDPGPGPGFFNGAPVPPDGSHYALYFDENLNWSSPSAP